MNHEIDGKNPDIVKQDSNEDKVDEPTAPQEPESFSQFWDKKKERENAENALAAPGSVSALQTGIALATSSVLTTDLSSQALSTALGIVTGGLYKSKQAALEEFSQKVSDYASSEEVISSLSEEIGVPKEDETEDEFVDRAKATLKNILRKKFRL